MLNQTATETELESELQPQLKDQLPNKSSFANRKVSVPLFLHDQQNNNGNGVYEKQTRNSILKDYEPSNLEFNYEFQEDLIVDPAQSRISTAHEEKTYYDNDETPIRKERDVYKGKLINKVLPKNGILKDKMSIIKNLEITKQNINNETNRQFLHIPTTQNKQQEKVQDQQAAILQTIIDENQKDSKKRDKTQRPQRFVYLIEDGSDLSTCQMLKVDVNKYLDKYDFSNQEKNIDRLQKYHLTLKQSDFERRGFLEMLHFASTRLKSNKYQQEDSEITMHKDQFTHLFTINGEELNNLIEIPEDVKVCVCSTTKHFKGIINSRKLVSFKNYKAYKDQNIKNHLYHKTYEWIKDKMLDWNKDNSKIDNDNKLLDLNKYNQAASAYGYSTILEGNKNDRFLIDKVNLNTTFQDKNNFSNYGLQNVMKTRDTHIHKEDKVLGQNFRSRSVQKNERNQSKTLKEIKLENEQNKLIKNFSSHVSQQNLNSNRKRNLEFAQNQTYQNASISPKRNGQEIQDMKNQMSEDNISRRNLPYIKFVGNARRQMMSLQPDKIDQIKRDKKTFPDRNQIDGEGITIIKRPPNRIKNKKIIDKPYNGESDDQNDSEKQDQYDEDFHFGDSVGRPYANSFFSGTKTNRLEIQQYHLQQQNRIMYNADGNSSKKEFSFKSRTRDHLNPPQFKSSSNNLLINQANNIQNERKPSQSLITNSKTNITQNTMNYRKKAREIQYEQIKKFAEEFNVEEQQIYSLLSEYKSLYKINKQNQEDQIENLVKKGAANISKRVKENKIKRDVNDNLLIVADESGMSQLNGRSLQDSQQVPLQTYMKYSVFKRLLHPDVLDRILQAFGVDTESKNATISQRQFIGLNCFLRYQSMPRQVIVKIWIKILDPLGLGKIQKEAYKIFFEKLARGKLTLISTIISSAFAEQLTQYLEQNGCLHPDTKEIIMSKMAQKLYDSEIEIEILSQTLRNIADLNIPDSKPITDFKFMGELLNDIQQQKSNYETNQ
ncbi:UNKNOWN [Stylonychia lemnae]|uniref:Uncharacterized protein n=1 Tax=Stylonychia lemnae TaxID=5949 RepID=A0A077ZX43_STYLE|nr:UNKNOWN [Stylonychia lemnae]|eukprot:CDW74465.1 UNKNOWN [Stylonychia lemnae]